MDLHFNILEYFTKVQYSRTFIPTVIGYLQNVIFFTFHLMLDNF